jgi:hypothetical protein
MRTYHSMSPSNTHTNTAALTQFEGENGTLVLFGFQPKYHRCLLKVEF